jgi:hypothetical protein
MDAGIPTARLLGIFVVALTLMGSVALCVSVGMLWVRVTDLRTRIADLERVLRNRRDEDGERPIDIRK